MCARTARSSDAWFWRTRPGDGACPWLLAPVLLAPMGYNGSVAVLYGHPLPEQWRTQPPANLRANPSGTSGLLRLPVSVPFLCLLLPGVGFVSARCRLRSAVCTGSNTQWIAHIIGAGYPVSPIACCFLRVSCCGPHALSLVSCDTLGMDALRNIRDYLRLLSRLRAQNSVGADDVDYVSSVRAVGGWQRRARAGLCCGSLNSCLGRVVLFGLYTGRGKGGSTHFY